MKGRGRTSAAALSVIDGGLGVQLMPPPADLTPTQAERWKAIVATKPVEWFQADCAPLLVDYVRAVEMTDMLSLQIEAAMAEGELGEIKELLKLRDMEARRARAVAASLRLTPQARYTPGSSATANRKANGHRPWQRKGDDE